MDVQTSQPASHGTSHHSNGVTIRHLRDTPEDRAFAADVMIDAFEGKMSYAVSKEKLPVMKKIMASYYHEQPPQFYTRNLVAEVEGRPVGFMGLKLKGDQVNQNMDHVGELGCWGCCRLMCFEMLLDFKPAPKRCLLDVVGVDASCRGRGVGKAFLDRAETEARNEGCDEIYLMVLTTNIAMRLYERQGYTVKSTSSNCCIGCIAGPPGAYHEMTKRL